MARKKKNKIIVDLDLPKNDSTMTKLYAILMVCGFIGLGCFGFWITNSHFTTSPNGQPLFVNLACGFDSSVELTPTLNDTCPMLEDEATPIVYESLEPWIEFREQGQYFDVPGRNISELNGAAPPVQPFTATCNIDSSLPADYSFRIHDIDGQVVARHDGNSHDENDKCHLHVENMEVGNMYSVVIMSNEEINSATYRFEMDYFDGTPEYINNKSLWIGPEVNLGGVSLRPTIFLNFFGFGFFMCFWPASFYWDRVKTRINDMEEKFPDFLRDLAEYWKGGLSMTVAVQTLAKSEYGALNDEVKKMSDQLSWGVAFSDVIHMFAERVGTPLVRRAISLISEANRAGGKISDILVTAANDSREIKFLERERIRSIASYISVIWTSYGVFLGVIVVLAKVFIPAIAGSNC